MLLPEAGDICILTVRRGFLWVRRKQSGWWVATTKGAKLATRYYVEHQLCSGRRTSLAGSGTQVVVQRLPKFRHSFLINTRCCDWHYLRLELGKAAVFLRFYRFVLCSLLYHSLSEAGKPLFLYLSNGDNTMRVKAFCKT